MKEKSKISVISKAVEEPVELEFGGKRNRKNKIIGIMELYSIKKTGVVHGANWHGKLTTCMIYVTLFVHIWWH